MAISIVRKGKELSPTYEKQCPHCECIFTYQDSDTDEEPTGKYYTDYKDSSLKLGENIKEEIAVYVRCPWCRKRIHVKEKYVQR